jgi:uncharacterized protein
MLNKNPGKIKLAPKLGGKHLPLLAIVMVLVIVVVLALVFGGYDSTKNSTSQNCGPYRDDRAVTINKVTFKAEVPDSQAAAAKGLGGRPCILPDEAMLFPFTQPGQYAFWMKGMKFPIDMIWINSNHQIVLDVTDVPPSSYPSKKIANPANFPAQYVLEIKANQSKELGITLGTTVQF